jgi:hypothetical protein
MWARFLRQPPAVEGLFFVPETPIVRVPASLSNRLETTRPIHGKLRQRPFANRREIPSGSTGRAAEDFFSFACCSWKICLLGIQFALARDFFVTASRNEAKGCDAASGQCEKRDPAIVLKTPQSLAMQSANRRDVFVSTFKSFAKTRCNGPTPQIRPPHRRRSPARWPHRPPVSSAGDRPAAQATGHIA